LHHDLADGPPGGRAFWIRADDGVRLRAAFWPGGDAGTVVLIPGRTEYIEKYGRAAADLAQRGYSTLCIDNRGQGLADRLAPNPMMGHVRRFADYQRDLAALLTLAEGLDVPHPLFLMGHSMGGAIGMRAVMQGYPVRAAVFSAPMWGIAMAPLLRPVARVVGPVARAVGLGLRYAPSTSPLPYVLSAPFEGNTLTTDRAMWDWMVGHLHAQPGLQLAGPSLQWLDEALAECRWLQGQTPPPLPCLTMLGGNERIVDTGAVQAIMARWPGARLDMVPGAEHELMMETPARRAAFFDTAAALFRAA
jgi:lysophospholipase